MNGIIGASFLVAFVGTVATIATLISKELNTRPALKWGLFFALLVTTVFAWFVAMQEFGVVGKPSNAPTDTPVVVKETIPVPQTVIVKETELVPQTVVVKETSVVTVSQIITVTQVVAATEAPAITEPLLGDTSLPEPTENGALSGDQLQLGTPGVESTPETPTATPAGYGLTLPFADDFADSFQPDWKVVNGRRIIEDQRLTSSTPELVMELGNDQLKNYTVSFDWSGKWISVVFGQLRYRDDPWGATRRCYWDEWRDSSWQVLREMPRCIGENGNVTFTLEDTRFSVKSKGTEISNMVVEGIETRGPFRLILSPDIAIDNFRLTLP
jgi:hypothetical protein